MYTVRTRGGPPKSLIDYTVNEFPLRSSVTYFYHKYAHSTIYIHTHTQQTRALALKSMTF